MKTTFIAMMSLLVGAAAGCGASSKCDSVTCATSEFCDGVSGTCKMASACIGVSCSAGQSCDGTSGKCVTVNQCAAVSCSGGQVCDATSGTCANPTFPTLGVQIDRMGRPAVNTALTNPFDLYGPTAAESSDTTKARYNADSNPATWNATWGSGADQTGRTGPIGLHLGILDGLDGTCANAFAYGLGTTLGFSKYGLINFVLAADALHVDTTQGTCSTTGYLAVEAATATAGTISDCGGRTLRHDVIDITYSVLAKNATSGVTDNIAETSVPSATFPFMLPAP